MRSRGVYFIAGDLIDTEKKNQEDVFFALQKCAVAEMGHYSSVCGICLQQLAGD